MPHSPAALLELSRRALGLNQVGLGKHLGVSRRTVQRWTDQGIPHYHMPDLARIVHPVAPEIASQIAVTLGTTLEGLGIVRPPPASPPSAPEPLPPSALAPAPPSPPPDGVVDAVVCAASDAMDMMPRDVRAGLLAAFARAREIGVTVEMVERALRAQLTPAPAPEPEAKKTKRG